MAAAAKSLVWSVALVWVAVLSRALPVRADERPPLQSIAAVRAILQAAADPGAPVRIRGVITWRASDGKGGAIQDESAGIWMTADFAQRMGVLAPDAPNPLEGLEPGMEVEVEGVVTRQGPTPTDNLYSTMILPRSVAVIGRKPLPEPRQIDHAFLFSGAADHLRVEVGGIVQGFRDADTNYWMLFLDAEPGEVGVLFPKAAFSPDPAALVDAEVRVQGVCGACYNRRGDFLSPRIHMNGGDDLVVERQPPSQPFDAPTVPLVGLAAYDTAPQSSHRMRVQGVVTYVQSGRCFYIQEGSTGVRVETRSAAPMHVGDRVEVAGFLAMNRRIAGLKEAVVRPMRTDGGPEPAAMTLAEIAVREAAANGLLVTLQARLLEAQRISAGCQLVLTADKAGFVAKLHGTDVRRLLALPGGSELSLTGIVEMDLTYDYRVRPSVERIGLLLRSPTDVRVVRGPPWWTPRRLLQAIAGLAVGLLVAFAWVLLLRRQVFAKSLQLANEMRTRRDAAVEFDATLRERNRLAANLHDTLLQTLGGIGYQLEACEASGQVDADETRKHFDMAQRMVDHAMGQLHDAVWTGHFGIEGMRERVERLGGSLVIESKPRDGTTVRANVSLREYDQQLV